MNGERVDLVFYHQLLLDNEKTLAAGEKLMEELEVQNLYQRCLPRCFKLQISFYDKSNLIKTLLIKPTMIPKFQQSRLDKIESRNW